MKLHRISVGLLNYQLLLFLIVTACVQFQNKFDLINKLVSLKHMDATRDYSKEVE